MFLGEKGHPLVSSPLSPAPGMTTTMAPGSGGGMMTTAPPSTSGQCPFNSGTLNIANGFPSSTSNLLVYPTTSTASGTSIYDDTDSRKCLSLIGSVVFSCAAGYALDPSIGGVWSCINGVWTTLPRCLSTNHSCFAIVTICTLHHRRNWSVSTLGVDDVSLDSSRYPDRWSTTARAEPS